MSASEERSIFERERQQKYDDAVLAWYRARDRESLPIPILPLQTIEARRDHPALWLTIRREMPQLHDDQVVRVVSLIVGVCPRCRAAPSGCQCANDD